MAELRKDGAVSSSNFPTYQNEFDRNDTNIYRCMIVNVVYPDDVKSDFRNDSVRQVLYDAIILGGIGMGQILSNCRLMYSLGGIHNEEDYVLKACTKPLSTTPLKEQDGDIVYIQFIQGETLFPLIIGCDKPLKSNIINSKNLGPKYQREFNGLNELINKDGELIVTQKCGTFDASKNFLLPNTDANFLLKIQALKTGLFQIQNKLTGTIKMDNGTFAIGANGVELLQEIVEALQACATCFDIVSGHVHPLPSSLTKLTITVAGPATSSITGISADTDPPDTSGDWTSAASELNAIKAKIESIKTTL